MDVNQRQLSERGFKAQNKLEDERDTEELLHGTNNFSTLSNPQQISYLLRSYSKFEKVLVVTLQMETQQCIIY